MERQMLDAMLLIKPQNSFYVSSFNAIIYSRPVIAIIPLEDEPTLIVPLVRFEHAKSESNIRDIRSYGEDSTGKDVIARGAVEAVKKILEEKNLARKTLGIEKDFITIDMFEILKKLLPHVSFKNGSSILTHSRMVKDEEEISNIRKAADLAKIGMAAALDAIKEGHNEIGISIQSESAMRNAWRTKYPDIETADFGSPEGGIIEALWCYCLFGERIGYACDSPKISKIYPGQFILPVILTTCNCYHAELERTIAFGKINEKSAKAFKVLLQAREAALDRIHPGVRCSEVNDTASNILDNAGFKPIHRSGHGIGLGQHEPPFLQMNDKTILQEGMVISVEPGIYLGNIGGIRHSDTLLITSSGYEFLTSYDDGLMTITR